MATYQSAVDLARIPLNDVDKTRYSDETLMKFANSAMLELVKKRPDIFVGLFNALPDGEAVLTDTLILPPGYTQTLAHYITAATELIDDEHANSGRATVFMQLFGLDTQ